MANTIVRQAVPSGADVVSKIAELTFRQAFEKDNTALDMDMHCAQHFQREIQHQELLDPNVVTLLAESDTQTAGFAQIRLSSYQVAIPAKNCSELHRIYVHKDYHGHGVAQALMARVRSLVEENHVTHLWLGVWEHNLRAISFYRKYGFQVVGEHTFDLGTDPQRDLVMASSLEHMTKSDGFAKKSQAS